jgi:hypothetical protein
MSFRQGQVIVGVKYVTGSDRALAKLARLVKKADTLMTAELWSFARSDAWATPGSSAAICDLGSGITSAGANRPEAGGQGPGSAWDLHARQES